MYAVIFPNIRGSRPFRILVLGLMLLSATALSTSAQAPPARLSLADVIVALRSQKVSLGERNKILTDAVLVRGITFALTPDIEKELTATGADKTLVNAIKSKSSAIKGPAVLPANETAKPPEYLTYLQRADADFARDDLDAALVEYSKAIELQPTLANAYFIRGRIFLTKEFYDQAITDFSKAIELEPKDAAAFSFRAKAWEKKGIVELAIADYTKALQIKPDDVITKANLDRITVAQTKSPSPPTLVPTSQPVSSTQVTGMSSTTNSGGNASSTEDAANSPTATPIKSVAEPELIDVGSLLAANTVRLSKPAYPPLALKANITGRVAVRVTIDENGNVISAKALDGHQLLRQSSEDAARRSKFKPSIYEGKPTRLTGVITYNYLPAR